MAERRVSFETSAEKFLGSLMERVLKNEAHLNVISENLARLIAVVEEKERQDVMKELQDLHHQTYSELSASLVANLTQPSAMELLADIPDSVSDDIKPNKN